MPARYAGDMTLKWRDAKGEHTKKVSLEDAVLDVTVTASP